MWVSRPHDRLVDRAPPKYHFWYGSGVGPPTLRALNIQLRAHQFISYYGSAPITFNLETPFGIKEAWLSDGGRAKISWRMGSFSLSNKSAHIIQMMCRLRIMPIKAKINPTRDCIFCRIFIYTDNGVYLLYMY
jgi:hypothetical protein